MKPFAVSCTTCRARLKVLDPSAIGQILACPKCNSMVQVVPPEDWTPGDEGEPATDGSASAISSIGAAAAQAASLPIAAALPSQLRAAPPPIEAASSAALTGSAITKRQAAQAAHAPSKPAQAVAVKPAPAARVAPVLPHGSSEAAIESSRWFWPTFSAATFVALAVAGLVIYFDRHNRVSADAVAQAPVNQPSPAPAAAPPTPASPLPAKPAVTEKAPIAPPVAPSTTAPPAAPPPAAPPRAAPPAAAVQPPRQDADAAAAPPAHPAAAEADPPAAPPAAPAAPQPLAHASLQRVPPRNVDVEARLADRLAGIEFHQSPLWQFLSDLSQLSTVPISLDVDALSEMNLSADTPISLQLKNTTLSGILDESLTARGLAWRAVGHQIQVGRPASQELRRVRYSVADLAGDSPESRRQFAAMVHTLVEPNGWSEANGSATSLWSEGALVVAADASAHAQLLVLCEKLRLARGLALRSRIEPARFHLDSRTAHAKAALEAAITVDFARPEALDKIVAYLRSTTRLNLLVDNVALAEDGMSAESEGAMVAQQQSFGSALAALVEPMELTYRVIDDRTFEITTPKAAARHAEIEFYPTGDLLAPGADGHELIARIARELKAADPTAATAAIECDTPSKYLIVRAPQAVQHRVESLLGAWRVPKQ